MRLFLAILLFALLSGQAFAHEPETTVAKLETFNVKFGSRGERAIVNEIWPLTSNDGESKEAFLMRAAVWMRNYTIGSSHETCASVCASPTGQTGIIVSTTHSQIACLITERCPAGMSRVGETIHSHPVPPTDENGKPLAISRIRPNATDVAFMRSAGKRGAVATASSANPYNFSDTDIQSGAGYLVTPTQLKYQDIMGKGRGSIRVVGDLPPMPPMPPQE